MVDGRSSIRIAAIVPCYNHGSTVADVISGIRRFLPDIIVVNDGSSDSTPAVLAELLPSIDLITFPHNQGKGAALRAGFAYALSRGFTHAITVDADGQHSCDDILRFIDAVKSNPHVLWIGNRVIKDESERQPLRSRFGRAFGAFWYRFHTGLRIPDTQCGFRAYPLEQTIALGCHGNRYEYEIETLVYAAWNGIEVRNIDVRLRYFPPHRRISHFRPLMDFLRISCSNARFSLIRIFTPWRTIAVPGRGGVEKVAYLVRRELTANATVSRAAWSLAVGVFLAIFPIHGFQVVTALALSVALRLNRPLVLAGVSISSAPFLPFIAVAAVSTGRLLLPSRWEAPSTVIRYGFEFALGSAVLAFVAGTLTLVVSYGALQKLRRRPSVNRDRD